jgi:hypothetical protein
MATEEFLSCMSKSAIEATAASIGINARPRAKETRAEIIRQVGDKSLVLPVARFALTPEELAERQKIRPGHCDDAESDDPNEDSGETDFDDPNETEASERSENDEGDPLDGGDLANDESDEEESPDPDDFEGHLPHHDSSYRAGKSV